MNLCYPIYFKNYCYCGNWVCTCGHPNYSHFLYNGMSGGSVVRDHPCAHRPHCECNSFIFNNNDTCTIECQMKYLAENNK